MTNVQGRLFVATGEELIATASVECCFFFTDETATSILCNLTEHQKQDLDTCCV